MRRRLVFSLTCTLSVFFFSFSAFAAEKWQGVDETVVERYSAQQGRPAKAHLIEPTGDALLFCFLAAGVVGGFALGYYYRDFMAKKGRRPGAR